MYYLISLKHTCKSDKYITLWGPNNSGYRYSQESAGIYTEIEKGYHSDNGSTTPRLVEEVNGLFIDTKLDGKCIPNCKAAWDSLGLKMTKWGLVEIEKTP